MGHHRRHSHHHSQSSTSSSDDEDAKKSLRHHRHSRLHEGSSESDTSSDSEAGPRHGSGHRSRLATEVFVALALLVLFLLVGLAIWKRDALFSSRPEPGEVPTSDTKSHISDSSSTPSRTIEMKTTSQSKDIGPSREIPSSTASSTSVPSSTSSSGCFPLSNSKLGDTVPTVARKDWWCNADQLYGFMGFSYPLEVVSCQDASNGFDKISKDMARMKADFGATMVRIYAPQCREVSVWENLVKAGAENGMGVIAQVWWGFQDDQNAWKKTQDSLYTLFESSPVAALAPFVIHSASFGSEPIGDHVNGGADGFIKDLKTFREKMSGFGIPVGISEDWDRPGVMSAKGGEGLGDVGKQIKENTDVTHAHIMAYYHPDQSPKAEDAWTYNKKQIEWLRKTLDQPTFLSQVMWASSKGWHGRGSHEDQISPAAHETFWKDFASNCAFFREQRVGWFVHTFDDSQEPGFGMIDKEGQVKIKDFKPERC